MTIYRTRKVCLFLIIWAATSASLPSKFHVMFPNFVLCLHYATVVTLFTLQLLTILFLFQNPSSYSSKIVSKSFSLSHSTLSTFQNESPSSLSKPKCRNLHSPSVSNSSPFSFWYISFCFDSGPIHLLW